MATSLVLPSAPASGFNFENYRRNMLITADTEGKANLPKAKKTGTTIVGVIYKDGVVLGADTRATEGNTIADKNCEKIHYIAPNIRCCGAGTAADTEYTTNIISANIELHRLETGKNPRVATACRLLKQYLHKYKGYISAALVLGGYDVTGPCLYTVAPHGSTDKLPYVTMGSGSLAAMSVFESTFKPNMELEEAKKLVRDAICAGIFNDLGSGSNVDLTVINKDGVQYLRTYEEANLKGKRHQSYRYPRGATEILTTKCLDISSTVVQSEDAMDTS